MEVWWNKNVSMKKSFPTQTIKQSKSKVYESIMDV